MRTALADHRGRITLGAKVLKEFGRRFAVVTAGEEVVLVPIPKDPLAELKRIGKKAGIDKYTLKELRRMAREESEQEIES